MKLIIYGDIFGVTANFPFFPVNSNKKKQEKKGNRFLMFKTQGHVLKVEDVGPVPGRRRPALAAIVVW